MSTPDLATKLVKLGAEIRIRDSSSATPLHAAAQIGTKEVTFNILLIILFVEMNR